MKLFDRIKSTLHSLRSESFWQQAIYGRKGSTGVRVNEKTAQNYSPVFACVCLAAETVSTLPIGVYRKTKDGRELIETHPIYKLLHDQANPGMSAQMFREVMQWNAELRGIALAQKIKDGYGRVRELIPMSPDAVEEYSYDRRQRKIFFKLTNGKILSQDKVFYFYGPGSNGYIPKSRISFAADSLSVGVAAEEYGRRFFGEGTNIGGFLKHEKSLSDQAYKRLKTDMDKKYKGLQKSHGLIILEEGMDYEKVGLSNNDSQFLETRRFQVEEVCRWFGMKPHMIGDLSHATYSNIEQQGIEAVRYSWRPRCVRWEQAINTQLIQDSKVYAEHNLDGLMRGDLPSQAQAWHSLIQDGVLNADEVRKYLNMAPQEGEQGKIYYMPLNMIDKSSLGYTESYDAPDNYSAPDDLPEEKSAKPGELRSEQRASVVHRRKVADQFRSKYQRMAESIVSKDAAVIRKNLAAFSQEEIKGWVSSDYVKEASQIVTDEAGPVIDAFSKALSAVMGDDFAGEIDGVRYESFVNSYIKSLSRRYGVRNREKLIELLEKEQYQEEVEKQLTYWQENKATSMQHEEITRQRSAFTKAAYTSAGVEKIRWVTNGESCPYCNMLSGQVVGVTEVFATEGSSIVPDGKEPLIFSSSVGHAPAHKGCDCDIVAERG